MRPGITRIGLCPQMAGRLRLRQIASYLPVVCGGDEEPLRVTGAIPELVCPGSALDGKHGLSDIAVPKTKLCVRQGELWINFDGAFEKRNRPGKTTGESDFHRSTVGFESFERWCRGFVERSRIFFHRSERLADAGLNLRAIRLSAFKTSSFLAACACSSSRMSPVRQFFARRPTTYWLPMGAIEPSRTAALPSARKRPARSPELAAPLAADPSAGVCDGCAHPR